ncbi:PAS domain S-box protein [bacterium]|nr:MAG: PAS domain S-box protein [bacterium]
MVSNDLGGQTPDFASVSGAHWALEATTDNVVLMDREFRVVYINRATARLNGITLESVRGRSIWEVWPGNVGTDFERNYRRAMAEGVPVRFEHVYLEPGKFDLHLDINVYPSPDGLAVFFQDVSVTKREAARADSIRLEAERALQEREATLRAALDSSVGGFYGVDKEGVTTVCNAAFLKMLGFARMEDAVGKKLHDVIHHSYPDGSHYPKEECPIYLAASGGPPVHVVGELFFRLDGSSFPVEYWTAPIVVDGEVEGAVTTFVDLSEQRTKENALQKSEAHYQSLFESLDEAFCTFEVIFDATGKCMDYRFLDVNRAFEVQTGIRREDALGGRTMREMVPDHEQKWFDQYGQVARTGIPIRIEDRAEALGRHYEIQAFRIGGEGSREVGAIFKDVSARWETEWERERLLAELTLERSRLINLFHISPSAIAVLRGQELQYEYTNNLYRNLFTGGEDVVGRTLAEVLPEACEQGFDRLLRDAMETGVPFRHSETPFTMRATADEPERTVYVDFVYHPIQELDGTTSGVFAHIVDVTDQVLARQRVQELAESLKRQTSLWDAALTNIADNVWVFDRDVRFRYANQRLLELWGLPLERIVGKSCEELDYAPEVAARLRRDTERVFETRGLVPGEVSYTSPTGESGLFEYVMAPVFGSDGNVESVAGSSRDVSERNAALRALSEREELFRTVFEQAPDDAILVTDLDRTLTAWNPAAERITGWRAEEVLGKPADMIFTAEDQAAKAPEEEAESAARNGKAEDERWHMRKDVSRFWGSGTMNSLHDAEGKVRGYLKVFRDATSRYEWARAVREMNKDLEAKVADRTSQLQAAVKEAEGFNYSIAHDLRAPLRAMVATSSILLEDAGADLGSEHRVLLVRQKENALRLGRLIDELLRLSRLARAEVKREPLDMTAMALSVFNDLEEQGRTNGCTVEAQEGMTAQGDAGLVRTVLHNLIGNACKFSPHGGTIRIREEAGAFAVADEGVGFDMEFAAKIFLPFERLVTEAEFEGTGIGLANVERIVRRHGGKVWVESERDKGTTFSFTLSA